ncbi:MAG: Smr/MutS family protein [Dysgonamonadaceae bacterium]|jgi:DNA mismatch repair protein MutS2|nr:Smr/MutS family protein [Dysgonamonadaceae bacterium]
MIYPENFEQKIGFDKIRQLITARCLSSLGEEKVAAMFFSSNVDFIQTQLYQTQEFIRIIREEDRFPVNYFYDVRGALKKIRIEGAYLIEKELFDILRSMETIDEILRFFQLKQESDNPIYPHLQALAADVPSFPQLIKQINAILDKFGKVKDSASPALADIRKQLTQTANSISHTLQSILRTAQSEGFVDKEATPTLRDGRLMIPVSPAYKRKLKGIVHDESATGKTVFIEPAEVVEANNKIRELESKEKREIVCILTAFTDQIRPLIPKIEISYQFLGVIDFIRAKALFAIEVEAISPIVESRPKINWMGAVHPLLYLSHRKQNKPVVPLDIKLEGGAEEGVRRKEYEEKGIEKRKQENGSRINQRILIISGPNAGGKSVLLKTVGLLQYMLQSGLLIPVNERSQVGIFNDIFLDIGDEQSIENDLSTYSSHLTNMKFMLKNARPDSLILIDEFGSGTEPQIGGAIAEALLHRFNEKGSFGVITTHYHNLKIFAEGREGVVNGAMLYDRYKMQPLFQLSIGNPGSSFAVEIARKIGLPEDVISEASEKVGQDYVSMDKYLLDIARDKRYWESKRQQIRQQEKRLEDLTKHYQSNLEKMEMHRKELITQAKTEAERLLSEANARIENTIKQIRETQADKEKTKETRRSLEAFKESLKEEADTENEIVRKINKIKDREARKRNKKPERQPVFNSEIIEVGDAVRIKSQGAVGEVIEKKDKTLVIAFGSIKTTVKTEQIEKISNNQIKKGTIQHSVISSNASDSLSKTKLQFKPEIDIRGMRSEEALLTVTYYIDDAIQCNAGRVRILHGTGSGALRQIVRDYLKTVDGIKRFQDEHVQFGGAGITVVEFE